MNICEVIVKDTERWSMLRTALWPETVDNHIAEIQEYFAGNSIDIDQVYVIFTLFYHQLQKYRFKPRIT